MTSKPTNITVIPALPGYFITGVMYADVQVALDLYRSNGKRPTIHLMSDPVIAWRISSYLDVHDDGCIDEWTDVVAITTTGQAGGNLDVSGIEGPNGYFTNKTLTGTLEHFLEEVALAAANGAKSELD